MNNRENEQTYKVNVEFSKYSKKFDNVPLPKLTEIEGQAVLSIEDRNRTHHINWDKIDYYTVETMR